MRYELTYIIPAKIEESQLSFVQTKVRDIVTGAKGNLIEERALGKRKLAFSIKQIRHGYYVSTVVEAEPSAVASIDRELRVAPDVLRHLMTKMRIVSPEQAAKEQRLRDKLQARAAERDRKAAEEVRAKEEARAPKPPAPPPMSKEEIGKKIEKMLEEEIET